MTLLDDKRLFLNSDHLDRPRVRQRVFRWILYSSVIVSSGSPSFFAGHPSVRAVLWQDHANLDARIKQATYGLQLTDRVKDQEPHNVSPFRHHSLGHHHRV